SRIRCEVDWALEKLKLNCRSGETFHSMEPRRMDEDALRILRTEPSDINTEWFSIRSFCVQRDRFETSARMRRSSEKASPGAEVIRGEKCFGWHIALSAVRSST